MASLLVASGVYAQEAKRIDVTDFEDGLEWTYSGGSILGSLVEYAPFVDQTIQPHSGEASLYVEYDNTGGTWQWAQLNWPGGKEAVMAAGMTELHMWVYFIDKGDVHTVGNKEIRLDFNDTSLGFKSTTVTNQWVELVWPISSLATQSMDNVTYFGGFISPGDATNVGGLYIDDIYFYRPAGIPDVESKLVYGFNEENPDTLFVDGWETSDTTGALPFIGEGEVEPSEGSNYMEFELAGGWQNTIRTTEGLSRFDRWTEVREVWMDVRLGEAVSGGWVQSALIIQTESGGWNQYAELGYADAVDNWKTLVWAVDMSGHAESLNSDAPWMNIWLSTNNGAADAGKKVFFDNFRVVVPVTNDVHDWSVF
ncbi:MAG: hypothetical protein GC154_17360 [bacterium]|nr:hypothetical protein [bacterium]